MRHPSNSSARLLSPYFIVLRPVAWMRPSNFDHHILPLDRNWKCLGPKQRLLDQRRAVFHLQIEGANLGAAWIAPGFSGAQVEFPAMPGATHHFAGPAELIGPRLAGFDEADHPALAPRRAFMRP